MLQKIKNYFVELKNNHIFLFIALIISMLLGFPIFLLLCTSLDWKVILVSLLFLLPILLVFGVIHIALKMYDKKPMFTKVITFILNSFIILFLQVIVGYMLLICIAFYVSINSIEEATKDYSKALKSINRQQYVAHFPKVIPSEAKNMEFAYSCGLFQGSEALLVKFDIDKEYIENELKKHKFISIEPPNAYKHEFDAMTTDNGRIKLDGITFYVIEDRKHENLPDHHFPYHNGIGVNKDFSQIVYYYTDPD